MSHELGYQTLAVREAQVNNPVRSGLFDPLQARAREQPAAARREGSGRAPWPLPTVRGPTQPGLVGPERNHKGTGAVTPFENQSKTLGILFVERDEDGLLERHVKNRGDSGEDQVIHGDSSRAGRRPGDHEVAGIGSRHIQARRDGRISARS